jgi:hypothetical protein
MLTFVMRICPVSLSSAAIGDDVIIVISAAKIVLFNSLLFFIAPSCGQSYLMTMPCVTEERKDYLISKNNL